LLTLRDPVTVPFQFPAVRTLNSRVSRDVEAAIKKAVQSSKAKRFQSAAEMKQALVGDGRPRVKKRKPAKPAARQPVPPVHGGLSVTPTSLDFGPVRVSGRVPKMTLRVQLPPGEEASLSVKVPWLHLRPQHLDQSEDVTVQVFPRRLDCGMQSLKGWGWLAWPARFLVPVRQASSDQITITSKSQTMHIVVRVIAVPPLGRVIAGWVGTVVLMIVTFAVAWGVLLALLAALGIAIV
jgi:hypothetical protein